MRGTKFEVFEMNTSVETKDAANRWLEQNPRVEIESVDYQVVRVEGERNMYSILIRYRE